jgi:anti-sigma regulatory factor (Ser/Thr protein kinase)
MFGFNRLRELIDVYHPGDGLIDFILSQLDDFTGSAWKQEDDITLLLIERDQLVIGDSEAKIISPPQELNLQILGEFNLPSEAGIERIASERVIKLLSNVRLNKTQVDRLKTAVAEATMNAIEHGNHFDRSKTVEIKVCLSENAIKVYITDRGGDQIVPENKIPDLEAKLAGLESPRGWGMYIIKKMVDHFEIISGESHHTVVLTMFLGG